MANTKPNIADLGKEQTAEYLSQRFDLWISNLQQRPPFSLLQADLMLLDPQVWFGLAIGNGPLAQAAVSVESPNSEVKDFVARQWSRIWATSQKKILRAKHYGAIGGEVVYKRADGLWEFDRFEERHPRDTRPLLSGKSALAGVRVTCNGKNVDLLGMKSLWITHDAEHGGRWGRALLERAYDPWYEKTMDGGAKALRRLRMIKDAWIGDTIYYDNNFKYKLPGGQEITARDIAREMQEMRTSGGCMALPVIYENGQPRKILEYVKPTGVDGATPIFDWIRDLDWDIFDGLLIPREVVEAGASGSGYSGRAVPFEAFLSVRDQEFSSGVSQIDQQCLRKLVQLNFGNVPYELTPQSLVRQWREEMKQGQGQQPPSGGAPGPSAPIQFSLVDKRKPKRRAKQMSIADAGTVDFSAKAAITLGREMQSRFEAVLAPLKKKRLTQASSTCSP